MRKYPGQTHVLAAVDCVIFGFDGSHVKLLLVKRSIEPYKDRWSLVGGFLRSSETLDQAATRVLQQLTGIKGVYMEQLRTYSDPARDPVERTMSTVFTALIDLSRYEQQLSAEFHAEWFPVNRVPRLVLDHGRMLALAKRRIRYQAALHPVLFELLPAKFTIPQLQNLYEEVFGTRFDKRNFSRKLLSTQLLVKLDEKDKTGSRKGAYYFKLNKRKYRTGLQAVMNLIPNPDRFIG